MKSNRLLHDKDTNLVYFSPWLKNKKEGHPDFYQHLKNLLNEMGIKSKELKSTNDYWARDYMPLQLGENDFLKYRYYPDYLVKSKNKNDIETITDATKVLRGMGISCRSTNLIIDGGNMVPCGPYIVMTDKVFMENGRERGDTDFKFLLESEIGHPVISVPQICKTPSSQQHCRQRRYSPPKTPTFHYFLRITVSPSSRVFP